VQTEEHGTGINASVELRPSARLAVLGLVLERPSYGYELVARFDRTFAEQPCAWRVTPQAIYDALLKLEKVTLIEPICERPPGRSQAASRQVYRATPTGARAMREWLGRPMPSNPSREELLLRLRFGEGSDHALREMLRLHAVACLEELERIGSAEAQTRTERLVKEDRRLAVQARLTWIDYALAELRGDDHERA
jgi:DNA-binding PadR family transcriptional regulator